ncbi:hypothetical protein [Streptomyces sp. RB17]|uniref:hypothetical protein n=1 Tax=Streptomyces sp. RB17 TaxID=2585197 RepID=UPI001295F42A|nr:hypothetical protein [Streptomyces sp. RB17]
MTRPAIWAQGGAARERRFELGVADVVAPVHQGVERLVAVRQVPVALSEQFEPAVQPIHGLVGDEVGVTTSTSAGSA